MHIFTKIDYFFSENETMNTANFKCHFCEECLGFGCTGELPGMGGVNDNMNFQLNCAAWNRYALTAQEFAGNYFSGDSLPKIRLAPMTGAVENIGYPSEEHFYYDIIDACYDAGIALSIGDGTPDYKFQYGVHAMRQLRERAPEAKAAVFIKPYTNEKIFQRIEWCNSIAESIGIDIDSFNIITMRRRVALEKKSSYQLKEIKSRLNVPFAIKGVFTPEDVDLVKAVHPDIVVISNHGGRIETRSGSTAEFLDEYARTLSMHCGEIRVDGGIRSYTDMLAARALGAAEVLIGRPLASALCSGGRLAVMKTVQKLTQDTRGENQQDAERQFSAASY